MNALALLLANLLIILCNCARLSPMIIRKVARMGHPILRQKAKELTLEQIKSPKTFELIQDMVAAFDEYDAAGFAAPQMFESIQLAVMLLDRWKDKIRPFENAPQVCVFINPSIKILDKKPLGNWEGCISLPNMRAYVERPRKIRVTYQDLQGNKCTDVAEGHDAIVIQHELDHLDGILSIDRLTDTRLIAFNDEFERFHHPKSKERK